MIQILSDTRNGFYPHISMVLPVFPLLPVKKDKEKVKTGLRRLLSWLAVLKD